MKYLKLIIISITPIIFAACMTPQKASKIAANLPPYELCKRYFYSAGGDTIYGQGFLKAYGDAATSRGINCDNYLSAIQNERAVEAANAAAIFGASVGILGASQPQPSYVAPQQQAPTRCRVVKNPYGDQVYCN